MRLIALARSSRRCLSPRSARPGVSYPCEASAPRAVMVQSTEREGARHSSQKTASREAREDGTPAGPRLGLPCGEARFPTIAQGSLAGSSGSDVAALSTGFDSDAVDSRE